MSRTLYEINMDIDALFEQAIDPETGEILSEEALAILNEYEMERDDKLENVGLYIKNLEADSKAIKEEADKLLQRKKVNDNRVESLRRWLQGALGGCTFTTPRLKISYRRSTSVAIDDMDIIPKEYLREKVEVSVDKMKLKDDLKAGCIIEGSHLEENISMQIK